MHARAGRRNGVDVLDALGGLQNGVDHDGLGHAVLRLELGEELVEIGDVPGAFDLGQHDDVELVSDRADDLDHVVERPGAVQGIHAGPQTRRAEIGRLRHFDEAGAGRFLGVGGDRVLEIAEHDVDLLGDVGNLGAHLLHVRRHEMDHALDLDRRLAEGRRRANGQRTVELIGKLHEGKAPAARVSVFPGRSKKDASS